MQQLHAVLLYLFIFCQCATSFSVNSALKSTYANCAPAKAKPLSTVQTGLLSQIPRLEIGLRHFLRTQERIRNEFELPQISMAWLIPTQQLQVTETPELSLNMVIRSIISIAHTSTKCIKRFIAVTSLLSVNFLWAHLKKVATFTSVIASVIPSAANAGMLKRYSSMPPIQKLATTPLFFLSNPQGNTYLQVDVQGGNPDKRILTYFMSSEDAQDYLNEVTQGNPSNLNDFRVTTVSMENVLSTIEEKKQSRKLERFHTNTLIRIQPSSKQCLNAESVMGSKDVSELNGISIPMFVAEGLVLKRSNGESVLPYYFCLEDLQEDFSSLPETMKLKVLVKDFREVMCLSKGTANLVINQLSLGVNNIIENDIKFLSNIAIMPPSGEINMLRQFYKTDNSNEYQKSRLVGQRR